MLKIRDTVTEMKNVFRGLVCRLNTEERISELEDISLEISKIEKQTEKKKQNIKEQCNNYKKSNLCVMGTPEGEEREKATHQIFKTIMTEHFLKLISDAKP